MKWTLPFLLLFIAGCSFIPLQESVVAPGGVIFQDDFSDPKSGWPQMAGSTQSMGYVDGGYRISVSEANYDQWAVPGYSFGDVKVAVEARHLEGPLVNRFGLICRYQDPRNFYFFVISSDGYKAIGKVQEGFQSLIDDDLMTFSNAIVDGNEINHLQFDCIGSQLSGYVNGQLVSQTTDADFAKGDAGLIAGTFDQGGVTAFFDNFIVTKP